MKLNSEDYGIVLTKHLLRNLNLRICNNVNQNILRVFHKTVKINYLLISTFHAEKDFKQITRTFKIIHREPTNIVFEIIEVFFFNKKQ